MAPDIEDEILNEKNPRPLDEDDIALLKTYVSISLNSLLSFLLDIVVRLIGTLDLCCFMIRR